jgi:hypothetical protein
MKKLASLLLCLFFFATVTHAAAPIKYDLVDAHVHYVDFAQNTDGVSALIQCMDYAGVTDAVLWGLPVTKIWGSDETVQPVHSLDAETRMYWDTKTDYLVATAYLNATKAQQKRLHPFICGLNGNDKNSLDQVKRLIQTYPGMWQGIGEIFAHHDYVSYMTAGDIPRPDSPAYDMVYKLAAKYKMPVNIHTNITSGSNMEPIYMGQLLNAVKNNPGTKFIWAHIGISNNLFIPELYNVIAAQFKKYPNLYVDLSWLVYDTEIVPHGTLVKEWLPVIEKYPDRFMIGTDIVGHFLPLENYQSQIRKYDLLLNALTPKTAKMVAHDNFLNLLPKGVVLKDEDKIKF